MHFTRTLNWLAILAVFTFSWRCPLQAGIENIRSTELTPIEQRLLDQWRNEVDNFPKPTIRDLLDEESFDAQLEADLQKAVKAEVPKSAPKFAPEVAAFIATKAMAEAGHAQAQFDLGCMYDSGTGVPQSYDEALKWWAKAAEKGHAVAQNNLGLMYAAGISVARDYAKAAEWYGKAADQGVRKRVV